jgi:hypothetical protein
MTKSLFISLATIAISSLMTTSAFADSCATLKNLRGDSCGTLKYDIDASTCPDSKVIGKPKARCSIDMVTVRFETTAKAFAAIAELQKDPDGKKSWVVAGVKESERPPIGGNASVPVQLENANKSATSVKTSAAIAKLPVAAMPAETAAPTLDTTKPIVAAPAAAPTAPALPIFTVGGYLDIYYQNNQNKQATTGGRSSASRNNSMVLDSAELTFKHTQGDVAFRVDFAAGEMVDDLNGAPAPATVTQATFAEPTRNISQAFITYTPTKAPGLTVNAGKMYTHIGYEVSRAKDDWLFSRGLIYSYGTPRWHEGVAAGYSILPDKLTATGFIYNAWDGRLSQEQNQSQTWGANLSFTPLKNVAVNYNYIGGPETADASALRQLHEINAQYAINQRFSIALDAILGSQAKAIAGTNDAKWAAYGVYGKAGIISWLSGVLRYEMFDDSDNGFAVAGGLVNAGTKQKISSWTAGLNADLGDGLETRLEYRRDKSDQTSTFYKNSDGNAADNEATTTLAVLYAF